jgi:hypothetical protein
MDRPSDFELVRIGPDRETKELFEQLARAVQNGDVNGAIVIAMCPRTSTTGKKYFMSLAGTAAKNPTYASGAMNACSALVQDMALEDAGIL